MDHQRALGLKFDRQAWVLGTVAKHLRRRGASDLDAVQFETWCHAGSAGNPNARRSAAQIVHRFCRYRRRLDPTVFVPDANHFPRRIPHRQPVIFGPAEVSRMLRIAATYPTPRHFPLYVPAARIAVILLYTTGLRRGELAHLTLADVDLTAATLRVRESKFHKSRFVPLSCSTLAALREYLRARLAPPWDIGADTALIGHHHGTHDFKGYSMTGMSQLVRRMLHDANVCDAHGRAAHVHDFRHSFAVQALLRWYRQGADVQAKLPQLSMYLGHVSIVSTAHYLHFIPDVARAASRQFGRQFGHLVGGAT
ncbi:MAG: tyrosine-type recombinase/integrase [Burkholderiaceae bacterium]